MIAWQQALQNSQYNILKSIRIWNANVGDAGAAAVAHAIKCLPLLKSIEMIDCLVGEVGCRELASVLASPSTRHVSALRLDHNPIGDEGVLHLCKAMSGTSGINELSLSYCSLSPASCSALSNLVGTPRSKIS
jgi:Ran GTPase-activating protein (RanGAP) involved in mRNA processing and transport